MPLSTFLAIYYWNELQKDKRFTSVYSRPMEEWDFLAIAKRVYFGTPMEQPEWKKNLPPRELYG